MNELTVFKFRDSFPVRVSDREGNPWFVAADVCKALEIINPRKAVTHLDDDEHTTVTFSDGRPGHGAQKVNIISESGLYALIIRSNKPAAREFRKWITAEVLPAIRRNGAYAMPQLEISDPEDDHAKRSAAELVEQTNRRLAAGENIPPHVLQYVSNIARVASGVWYRDNFGVDGHARKLLSGEFVPLLPNFTQEEDRVARRILKVVRKYGKCCMRDISHHCSNGGFSAEERMRLIKDLVNAGILHAEGIPGQRGAVFRA
ncbi:MAG: Bro-N domain-containing protein [Clostridia bacterium]|nr:Bro-N domain-containing protein [Clostridia bacterium]